MPRILLVAPLAAALVLAACSPEPDTAQAASPDAAPAAVAETSVALAAAVDPSLPTVTVYKSPTCGCCVAWVEHLQEHGFPVETVDVGDPQGVKAEYGIPAELQSCHTAVVDGYVVEGHVPAADVKRLLAEQPEAGGLAVPGMPIGSPGMEQGDTVQPYDVLLIDDGQASVFARHGP